MLLLQANCLPRKKLMKLAEGIFVPKATNPEHERLGYHFTLSRKWTHVLVSAVAVFRPDAATCRNRSIVEVTNITTMHGQAFGHA
jgi:hypothetical protein